MRAFLFSLLIAAAVRAENFAIVRESSGSVPKGTVLRYETPLQAYTNGQYSLRMFTKVDLTSTNSEGVVSTESVPRCVFWDKTEPYIWDWYKEGNIYRSADGFIALDFRDSLP